MTTPPDFQPHDVPAEPADHSHDDGTAGLSAWGISIIVHAVALLLLVGVVFMERSEVDKPALRVTAIEAPQPIQDPPPQRRLQERPQVDIEPETDVEVPLPDDVTLPTMDVATESEQPEQDAAEGRTDALSSKETGGAAAFMAIGANSGASGAFGRPAVGDRGRIAGFRGATHASEGAVEAALRWFARHQSPNGQWDVDGYALNCEGAVRCEPGQQHTGSDGDLACTGYALLCFLGAGYDHRSLNKYRVVVRSGLEWLLSQQQDDGLFGKRNYEHAVAAMALIEAYAMTNDLQLKEPAQRAVDIILERQSIDPDGYPLGWDYAQGNVKRQDSSVTGWNVMALKSAKVASLDVGQGLAGAKRWLVGAWQAANANWDEIDAYGVSSFPYVWNASTGDTKHDNRMPMGALCAVFLGSDAKDPMLQSMVNRIVAEQKPASYPTNTYYLYYNTMAVFQVGGEHFKTWNEPVRDMLVEAQRQDDCFSGSWDWEGTGFHGHHTGRLLSTAYCCLSLEVYYRYLPMAMRSEG